MNNNETIVISGKANVDKARLVVLKHALRLETMGMTRRGRSVYAIVKEEFGFKGSKIKVLRLLIKMIDEQDES